MRTPRRRIALPCKVLAAFVLASSEGQALAQVSRFANDTLPVINASTFVNEPSGKQFKLRDPFRLTPQATPAARKFASDGYQVRVFALDPGKMQPTPWAFFDPCYVYVSTVLLRRPKSEPDARTTEREVIEFGPLSTPYWLTLAKDAEAPVTAGRHVMVFERASDPSDLVRLNKNDRDRYFASSLYFEVLPERVYSRDEANRLLVASKERVEELERDARNNAPDKPCYRYQLVRVAGSDDEQLAYLEDCNPEEFGL
jgi:hypothetical protein